MRAANVVRAMLGQQYNAGWPADLLSTDRILQRWAVSIGSGLPSDEWDDRPVAKPPRLDDETAIIVDQCVLHSPPRTRSLVTAWYRTPKPREVIAHGLGMNQTKLESCMGVCLHFMRHGFENSHSRTLLRLLSVRA